MSQLVEREKRANRRIGMGISWFEDERDDVL
jgi:hypothetical protein